MKKISKSFGWILKLKIIGDVTRWVLQYHRQLAYVLNEMMISCVSKKLHRHFHCCYQLLLATTKWSDLIGWLWVFTSRKLNISFPRIPIVCSFFFELWWRLRSLKPNKSSWCQNRCQGNQPATLAPQITESEGFHFSYFAFRFPNRRWRHLCCHGYRRFFRVLIWNDLKDEKDEMKRNKDWNKTSISRLVYRRRIFTKC